MASKKIANLMDEFSEDIQWFTKNYPEILKEHNNQYVAIKNKKIVAANSDFQKVMSELEAMKIDSANTFVRFVSKVKMILISHG
ncbi:MAG TPA: DUF5678 domain-containing protein [Candidatus Nanoarchaeia archaeon]|nr:DUF5678 domain-containing protein [Candidatus Nanoarchaeia archaeon]